MGELKYRQLQKLAKEKGVKANLPRAALIEALLQSNNENDSNSKEEMEEISEPLAIESELEDKPKSRRTSKKKSVETEKASIGIIKEEANTTRSKNSLPSADRPSLIEINNAKTGSKQESKDTKSLDTMDKSDVIEIVESKPNSRRGSKRKSKETKSLEDQTADVEKYVNQLISNVPRKRSRNSSSMIAASNQLDDISSSNQSKNNSILPASRRNSRISRLFDKDAFDIEAAKVSRFAEHIVNSPRKRSSILNLTPIKGNQSTLSVINSPLVQPSAKKTHLQQRSSTNPHSPANYNGPKKTPLHQRPSMNRGGKTTEVKKKKTVTMTITKAKERVGTGIPRPRKVPDFAKLHAKQFGKMDDIGKYLDKKKERMAGLTPGPNARTKSAITPSKKSLVTEVSKVDFNFSGKDSQPSAKKPFVFKATTATPTKVLHNITNKSPEEKKSIKTGGYKPYTGKLKPWNAKDSLKNRQEMASKNMSLKNAKDRQMNVIKGVRMNKRMELMMQKRNAQKN